MKMKLQKMTAVVSVLCIAVVLFSCGNSVPVGTIEVSGFVEAVQVRVSTQISGTIMELRAEEGDRVRKGTPLAVLKREDLEAQLAASEAAALRARARLADLEAGSRKEEIRQSQAALEQALAQYEKARLDTGRYRKLYAQEAAAEAMFEDVKTRFDVSKAQVRQAEERLALVKAGTRPNQILASKAEVEQAEKTLDALRVTWSYTRIVSPVDGIIQVKNAEPGEVVPPNFPVYTVLNPLDIWVRVYIPESEIPNVKIGAKAEIVLDAFPDSRIAGTVTYISPEAEFTPRNVQTKKERVNLVFEVKVTVDNPDEKIRPGLPVDVYIKTTGEGI